MKIKKEEEEKLKEKQLEEKKKELNSQEEERKTVVKQKEINKKILKNFENIKNENDALLNYMSNLSNSEPVKTLIKDN